VSLNHRAAEQQEPVAIGIAVNIEQIRNQSNQIGNIILQSTTGIEKLKQQAQAFRYLTADLKI